ncbi:MAG: MATE family efflux transporter [Eubacteriales bacterium]|nr:MATE family efflux transporter [Eubacteriales bacterium]
MSSKELQANKMGVMPVGKLLANMALPVIISMFVQALYNVVDSIYVSQVSESAVTALSLAFPVQNVQVGFSVGIGVGINSLLSKKLGEGDREGANRAAGNGLVLMLISVSLFMIFGAFFTRPYFEIQSDVAETVEGGILYTRICTLLSIGMFVQIFAEKLLQSTGRTVYTMIIQGTGAITNIILDPIFIHGWLGLPAMGIAGAAVATVLGQAVGAGVGVYFALRHNPEVKITLESLVPHKPTMNAILAVGVPGIVMNCIGAVMNFGMNQILQGFAETATGVFGVYFKLQSFFFMPLFGINSAAISIIAYNYGAQRPDRIMHTVKLACGTALGIMAAGLVIFQLAPDLLLGMFNPSPMFLEIGRVALRTISWSFPAAAFGVVLGAVFQALGNGIYTTVVSLCRQLCVLLPVAYLLSLSGNIHLVWLSFLIAEVASAAVTVYYFRRIYKKKIKPMLA